MDRVLSPHERSDVYKANPVREAQRVVSRLRGRPKSTNPGDRPHHYKDPDQLNGSTPFQSEAYGRVIRDAQKRVKSARGQVDATGKYLARELGDDVRAAAAGDRQARLRMKMKMQERSTKKVITANQTARGVEAKIRGPLDEGGHIPPTKAGADYASNNVRSAGRIQGGERGFFNLQGLTATAAPGAGGGRRVGPPKGKQNPGGLLEDKWGDARRAVREATTPTRKKGVGEQLKALVGKADYGDMSSEEARVARLMNADKRMRQTRAEPVPDRKHRKKKQNYTAAAGTALTGALVTAPYAAGAVREDARMRSLNSEVSERMKRANGMGSRLGPIEDDFDRITNAERASAAGKEAKAVKGFRNMRLKQTGVGAALTGLTALGMHKIQNAGN